MSGRLSELKVRLSAKLKQQYKDHCKQLMTDMAARTRELVEADIVGRVVIKAQDKTPSKPKADPPQKRFDSIMETLGHLETSVTGIEHKQRVLIDRNIEEKPDNADRLAVLYDAISEDISEAKVSLSKDIGTSKQAIEAMRSVSTQPLDRNVAITSLSFACIVGVMIPILMLALTPGNWSLSRAIAREIVGADSYQDAANLLAGKGNIYSGRRIAETHALVGYEFFRVSYSKCLERAKKSETPFDCIVTFGPIVAKP